MNIVITGSTKGLGFALAKNFIKDKSNKVICSGRDPKFLNKLQKKFTSRLFFHQGDLSIERDLINFEKYVHEKFNKIDVLIHSLGGGLGFKEPLLKKIEFEKLFNINIGIAAEVNRSLNLKMKKNSSIIMVGSTASLQAIGSVGYNTIKSSILAYVKSLAINLFEKKIYVYSILPGAFEGYGNAFNRLKITNPKAYNDFKNYKTFQRKINNVNDYFPIIEFLISKNARLLNGSSLNVDALETNTYHI